MTSAGFLIVGVASIPALLSVRIWWDITRTGEDLSGFHMFDQVRPEDNTALLFTHF